MTVARRTICGERTYLSLSLAPCRETRRWARRYIELGWQIVPVKAQSKAALGAEWNDLRFADTDIDPNGNIGIRSVEGIVVADCDAPETVALADAFLPLSTAVWGRESKPRAKRLYRITPADALPKTLAFKDLADGATILELRANHQDVAPPSIHPSGEPLSWAAPPRKPEVTEADTLIRAHRLLATAGLVARHYAAAGARHDWTLALAGVLRRCGLTSDEAVHVVEFAARHVGDPKVDDRLSEVRSTFERSDDEPFTGAPALDADGGRLGASIRRVWQAHDDHMAEAIDRLNERFAIVAVGNKMAVVEQDSDGTLGEFWPFDEFKRLQIKNTYTVETKFGTKVCSYADAWLKDKRGRQYRRLVYAMPGSNITCGPDDLNGWQGFSVEPRQGDWSRSRAHIGDIVCDGHADRFEWVLNWCADLVQKPGRHAMTALVMRGAQGTGKGQFANGMLGALFGRQQYLHIIGANQLTGEFNEHLSGKVLIYADESTWGGNVAAMDKLKGLVTEDTVPIHRKFLKLVEEPSSLHIVIASNNEWPVAIPADDRRFSVLDVSDARRQDQRYFGEIRAELEHGGLAALLHDLLAYPVNENLLREPLRTEAKADLLLRSMDPIERWWYERLEAGALPEFRDAWPEDWLPRADVHTDYHAFLRDHHRDHRTRRATETEVGKFLRRLLGRELGEARSTFDDSGRRQRAWNVPSLARCREIWLAAKALPADFAWSTDASPEPGQPRLRGRSDDDVDTPF